MAAYASAESEDDTKENVAPFQRPPAAEAKHASRPPRHINLPQERASKRARIAPDLMTYNFHGDTASLSHLRALKPYADSASSHTQDQPHPSPCSQEELLPLDSQASLDSQLSEDMTIREALHAPPTLSSLPSCLIGNPGPSRLASRRGLLLLNVEPECMQAAARPETPSPDSQESYAMSHPGWFCKCRGCAQLTGASFKSSAQAIPFCCVCTQRLTALPEEQARAFEQQLLHIHAAWKRSGH